MQHLSISALALTLTACTTSLTSVYVPAGQAPPNGAAYGYYLPREAYAITVTYQLIACPTGVLSSSNPPRIQQQVTVVPADIADPNEHYYITYSNMDSAWKNTTFQAAVYPNQTLKGVGASIASQVAQSATNVISAGLSAAKLAGALAAAGPLTCSKNVQTAMQLTNDLAGYSDKTPVLNSSGTTSVRTSAADVLTRLQTGLTLQVTGRFDPSTLSDTLLISPSPDQVATWFDGTMTADIQSLVETKIVLGPALAQGVAIMSRPANPIQGVAYRDPMPALLKACAGLTCSAPSGGVGSQNEVVLATQAINLPQLGQYVILSLQNQWFDNNNLAVAFATNGVPCAITYGTQSQVYQISTILNNPTLGSAASSAASNSSNGGGSSSGAGGGGGKGGSGGATTSGGSGNSNASNNTTAGTPSSSSTLPTCS